MKDTDLYQQVLGLDKPWQVREVKLELAAKRVTAIIECDRGVRWGDPGDGSRAHIHGWTKRQWRHLDTCQFETALEAASSVQDKFDSAVLHPSGSLRLSVSLRSAHVSKHLNEAVDKVRKAEHRKLMAEGDDTPVTTTQCGVVCVVTSFPVDGCYARASLWGASRSPHKAIDQKAVAS